MKNYECTISVNTTPSKAFNAITQEMSSWWTEMTSVINEIGDKTTAKFEDGTTWSFEVTTLEKDKVIELYCYEANHIHPVTTPDMRTEWKGTTLKFQLEANENGTTIYFTHVGLTPDINCYDICHAGWDFFFGSAFKAYLNKSSLTTG